MPGKKLLLFIDIILFVCIILLFSPQATGLSLHEWLGLIFALPVILHLLFSWAWIRHSPMLLLKPAVRRRKINLILNLMLFIFVIEEFISGLIISHSIIPALGIKTINDWHWRALHNQSSVAIVVLISLHISMNWSRIVTYFQKQSSGATKKYINKFTIQTRVNRNLKRCLMIVLAALAVAVFTYLIMGAPQKAKLTTIDDATRLKLNVLSGTVQIFGAIIVITILAYIGRRFLKVRL